MGLKDFVNKLRKDKGIEQFPKSIYSADLSRREFDAIVNDYMTRHSPRFANSQPQDFVFNPIDGDVLRMKLLGCIAGDEFVNLKTNEHIKIERDEIERFDYIPKPIAYKDASLADEANRARMYMHQYEFGDVIKDKLFTYKFVNRAFQFDSEHYDYSGYETTKAGFEVKCHEKDKPLRDVYVRSGIAGKDVVDISGCFDGCKNLISVKHLPDFELVHKNGCLRNSGIVEIPEDIKNARDKTEYRGALAGCYNITDLGKTYVDHILFNAYSDRVIVDTVTAKKQLDTIQKRCDDIKDFIDGKPSHCKAVESVSFVYQFQPVNVTRVKMGAEWYVMNGKKVEEYGYYMKNRFSNQNDISDLTTSSFSSENQTELARKIYEDQSKVLEEAKTAYEKSFEKLTEKINEMKSEYQQAQTEKPISVVGDRDDNDER